MKKIILIVFAVLALFLGYVATREGKFHYERSGFINASPATVHPYISQLKLGNEWSPFMKKDPNVKTTYSGTDGTVGAAMEFDGSNEVGAGRIEILSISPETVELRLTMTKPIVAENKVIYKLMAVEQGTVFTWAMEGDGGFIGKLMSVFIDCEKMIGDEFSAGISNLKTIIEQKNPT